ncbi:hypothetical protein BHM03_00033225 [Ensete ventricosum]|nr:hypothetical protein BHM03_00033225 [Ensete ventricosum]
MRLNRVESFYAFLLRFRSEGSPCKGQPGMATTSPLAGATDCSQGPLQRGGWLRSGPARKGAVPARGQTAGAAAGGGGLQYDTRKGLLPTVCIRSPAASQQGTTDYGFGARRKAAYGQRHRPQGRPPAVAAHVGAMPVEVPTVGVAAPWQSGYRRASAAPPAAQGSGGGDSADGGKRG